MNTHAFCLCFKKTQDPEFEFIAASAPTLVEVKGASAYIKVGLRSNCEISALPCPTSILILIPENHKELALSLCRYCFTSDHGYVHDFIGLCSRRSPRRRSAIADAICAVKTGIIVFLYGSWLWLIRSSEHSKTE